MRGQSSKNHKITNFAVGHKSLSSLKNNCQDPLCLITLCKFNHLLWHYFDATRIAHQGMGLAYVLPSTIAIYNWIPNLVFKEFKQLKLPSMTTFDLNQFTWNLLMLCNICLECGKIAPNCCIIALKAICKYCPHICNLLGNKFFLSLWYICKHFVQVLF